MSAIAISYSDLKDSAQEADKVAKKVDAYADELSGILNKISKYDGKWTSYMSGAYDGVATKIDDLRTKYTMFQTYSDALYDLLDECKDVDERVKKRVSELTGDFCIANGITNPVIETYILGAFEDFLDNTAVGRFLSNTFDQVCLAGETLLNAIANWYATSGLKMYTENLMKLVIEWYFSAVETACAVIAAIYAPTAENILKCISTSQRLTFTTTDMTYYLFHGGNACIMYAHGDIDEATRYRMLESTTFIDFLRNGFIWDENDETWFNQQYEFRDGFADFCEWQYIVGDICDMASTIISLADSGGASVYGFGKIEDIGDLVGTISSGNSIRETFSYNIFDLIKELGSNKSAGEKGWEFIKWSLDNEPSGIPGDFTDIVHRIDNIMANGKDGCMDFIKDINTEVNSRVINVIFEGDVPDALQVDKWGKYSFHIGPIPYFDLKPLAPGASWLAEYI